MDQEFSNIPLDYDDPNIFEGVDISVWPFMQDDTLEDNSSLRPTEEIPTLLSPPTINSDTIYPNTNRGPPSRKDYPGHCNFRVEIHANKTKKSFLYSHKLNRIYVCIDSNFSVHFNWDHKACPVLYVRATVVFWEETQAEKRVERCIQHLYIAKTSEISEAISRHVLHSSREPGTHGVYYCGEPNLADSWYSVLVMFNKTNSEPCTHAYKFTCKNSCISGINRRSIGIVFTLEDANGQVLGRQSVGARVCACPRRDLRKDENQDLASEEEKQKAKKLLTDPPLKKIKLEVVQDGEEEILTLPPLPVVGRRAMVTGLEVMQSMMQQTYDLKKNDPEGTTELKNCIEVFQTTISELNK